MNDLDRQIQAALQQASDPAGQDDATILGDFTSTFSGRYRGLFMIASVKALAIAALGVWAVYEFFVQTSVQWQLACATLVVLSVVTLASIYNFFWITMNKNETNREIKRLELQLALLTNKLESQQREEAP